jgi:hypothetical protein
MSLRVNSLGVNTQSSSDSATTLISNRALIDHNYEGIVTSAGSVTKWLNTANRSQAAYFDGVNDFISTPDSGALTLTGAVQTWTFYGVAAVDWTPGIDTVIASQWNRGLNQRAWSLVVENSPAGRLQLRGSLNGISEVSWISDSAPLFTDGAIYNIRVTRNASTGVVTFETSLAGGIFATLGLPVAGTSGDFHNSTATMTIGCSLNSGAVESPFNGTIQRFTLYDDDRLAASWSADDYTDYNATTMESVGPELWTGATSVGTGWTDNGDGSFEGVSVSSSQYISLAPVSVLSDDATYEYTFTISDWTLGTARLAVYGDDDVGAGTYHSTNGTFSGRITVSTATGSAPDTISIQPNASFTGTISNISVKQISTYTLNNGAIIRDPFDMDVLLGTGGLRRHDSGAVLLDGVSGSYVSTPDSAAASVTGNITLIAYAALDDWTPPTDDRCFIGKFDASPQKSYIFRAEITTGKLEVLTSNNGSAQVSSLSTVSPSFIDGTGHWVRATINLAADTVNFYTSDDPKDTAYSAITWTLLGAADVAHVQTGIHDGTSLLTIGAFTNAGIDDMLSGQIYRACVIDGILPQGLEFGEELVTNGDFSAGMEGWTKTFGTVGGTGTVTGGELTVSSAGIMYVTQPFTTVIGVEYVVSGDILSAAGANFYAIRKADNAGTSINLVNIGTTTALGSKSGTFIATATTTYVSCQANTASTATVTFDNISVKPTAALAVDFDARLAGLTAGSGDTFFGAEMLKPSARTINATDWTEVGTGSITDNGDGTVTVDDQDATSFRYRPQIIIPVVAASDHRMTFQLSQGTSVETKLQLEATGGTPVYPIVTIDWTDPTAPTPSACTVDTTDLGAGIYEYTMYFNTGTGNTSLRPQLYAAGTDASVTGSVIVHGEVSLQAEWTLNGGAKIQNSGQAVVQAGGVGGIETTVAPANIPTPMTMFMVGKADLLNGGVFTAARNDSSAGPFIQATIATFNFNAGSVITKTSDTGFYLHTVRHNGDATTSYQIDSGTPVVGDAGAEPYNFGTFFSDLAAGSNLTGSMGRFLLFDEELSDAEVAFIQTLLLPN